MRCGRGTGRSISCEGLMKVVAHQDMCVSAGQCAFTSPALFDQRDDDGVVVLLNQPIADQHDDARRAVESCPARAIDIEE
uniref:Ferredoxin n=2 Tax=unclassified Mycobacterium TaxID=2642494 RepID=A1UKV2_MYCSK